MQGSSWSLSDVMRSRRGGNLDLLLTEYIKCDYDQTTITQLGRGHQPFIAVTHCDSLARILPCIEFSGPYHEIHKGHSRC